MWFERDGKVCISLPGVPFEMQYLMQKQVIPRLLERFPGKPIVHRTLLTACEGESNIAKRLENFEDSLPAHIKLAYLPSLAQVRLRLTGILEDAQGPEALKSLQDELDEKTAELKAELSDIVFGTEQESLEEVVGKLLLAQNKTFGTAESCTGGYIAHLITRIPGSSAYYPGSVVSYSYDLKNGLLGVQKETLEKEGAVSERAVIEMAQGALKTLGVDVSLSVSGIAGPGGGTPDKPVGTVWMAVADKDRVVTQRHTFWRDREKNIQLTSVYALNMVRKFLLEAL
jgi:nicotinamide-nucleotide amidase